MYCIVLYYNEGAWPTFFLFAVLLLDFGCSVLITGICTSEEFYCIVNVRLFL